MNIYTNTINNNSTINEQKSHLENRILSGFVIYTNYPKRN